MRRAEVRAGSWMAMRSPTWRTLAMTPERASAPALGPSGAPSDARRLRRRARTEASRRKKNPPAPTLTEISAITSMDRMDWIDIAGSASDLHVDHLAHHQVAQDHPAAEGGQ